MIPATLVVASSEAKSRLQTTMEVRPVLLRLGRITNAVLSLASSRFRGRLALTAACFSIALPSVVFAVPNTPAGKAGSGIVQINPPPTTTTTINFDIPALPNASATVDVGSKYLAQGIEFVDASVQPVSHPIVLNSGGAYLLLDPSHARSGKQVLASYISTDELLETLAGFLVHFTKFSNKVSLYAGASSPNNPTIQGATVQMTGYDEDGNIVATSSKQVGASANTQLSISTTLASIAYCSVQIPGTLEPRLEVDDLTFVTPGGSALTAGPSFLNGLNRNPVVGNNNLLGPGPALIVPKILSVSQGVANPVTIVGDKPFTDAYEVYFGKIASKNFSASGNTLTAFPPTGMLPGSNARISVLLKNRSGEAMAYSEQTSEIPIGEIDATGPLLTDQYDETNDQSWDHGQGRSFGLLSPKNLLVDTPYPVFYILSQFMFTPSLETKFPPGLDGYAGNKAIFYALLEMCSIDGTQGTPPSVKESPFNFYYSTSAQRANCTNWDGTTGKWTFVGKWATKSLTSTGLTYLGVPTGSSVFDIRHYVRTLRIIGAVWLRDTQGDVKERSDFSTSPPFNVAVVPNAFYQIKVQPKTIVFAPPGDQSTASVTVGSNFYTSYTTGRSKTQSNKLTDGDNSSWTASLAATAGGDYGAAKASASFTEGMGGGLDTTTTAGYAVQNGSQLGGSSALNITRTFGVLAGANTIPGNGKVCASATDCSTQTLAGATWWAGQPFWSDTFVLTVHPQYAFYVLGDKTDRSVMFASVAGDSQVQVLDLWACASGVKLDGLDLCSIQYTNSSVSTSNGNGLNYDGTALQLELTPTEAKHLLALDPFYVGGQGASLPATRASLITSDTYGTTIVNSRANPVTLSLSNTQVKQQQASNQTTYTSSIVDTTSSTESDAGAFAASFIVGFGFGSSSSTTDTSSIEADTQSVYQDSTATSTQAVTTAAGVLNDLDNRSPQCKTCHNPLAVMPSVNVYLDRTFGAFMFQDPAAGPAPSTAQRASWQAQFNLPVMAMDQERRLQRFDDVSDSSPGKIAIGMISRLGIMMGYRDGKFHPGDPITKVQLAIALRRIGHLTPPKISPTFTDLSTKSSAYGAAADAVAAGLLTSADTKFNPTATISRDEFRTIASKTFKLLPASATGGQEEVSRGDAAEIIFASLQMQK
jgi:S-layer homology domain